MSIARHLSLRDQYFSRLNKLIYEGTLTWQVEEGYDYEHELRIYHFVENVLEKSMRAFVDGADDARSDPDERAIVNEAAYERFCDRIRPYVSEASLKRFTHFVDNTFLMPEMAWNTRRKTFRSLAEVLEELRLRRPKEPGDILSEEIASTVATHVEDLYSANKRSRCVNVGGLYWTALRDLILEAGNSEQLWKSMYYWGGSVGSAPGRGVGAIMVRALWLGCQLAVMAFALTVGSSQSPARVSRLM